MTLAYVAACGADTAGWEQRWREIKRALATPAPPRERPPALENLVAPMQLPPAVAAMFGRDGTLRTLDALAEQPREPGAPLIVAITGPAGVGKTALAVRWAHRVAARFADGVLMADLRGYAPGGNPVEAGEQLETFLRAMGVPATSIPAGTEARSALLRSVLGNRRVLIVLDNARSADQVRELLPASEHCAVVITSRAALPGLVSLYGAVTIRLGHLAESDARALLLSRLGPEHAMAEPELLARVSGLCAGLPLALCILADRAATEPSLGLVGLAEAMGDARGRLRGLAGEEGHSSLPALLSWTYRSLPTGAARMFRRLALHPGGEIGIHAAAALAGTTPAEARRDVLVLLDVHLLEQSSHERFRFHDLVNLFAAECAERDESPSEHAAALRRGLTWYLHTADAACRHLVPRRRHLQLDEPDADCSPLTFSGYHDALLWCERERLNLIAAVRSAHDAGHHDLAWQLPAAQAGFFAVRKHWDDVITTHTLGIASARQTPSRSGEAWLLGTLGMAHADLRHLDEAVSCFQQALLAHRDTGNALGEAATLLNLGFASWTLKRHDQGLDCFGQALTLFRATGERHGEAMTLNNLGEAYAELDDFDQALEHLHSALVIFRENVNHYGEGSALDSLGQAHRRLGNHGKAATYLLAALEVRRGAGDRHGQATTLRRLGETHLDARHRELALPYWREARAIFRELGDPQAEDLKALLDAS